MLDGKNLVQLQGGVVADPEVTDKFVKFSIAVDRAGNEKDGSTTGYFDIIFWLHPDYNSPQMIKFVTDNVRDEKIKKGSRLNIIGRLVHERWTATDGSGKRSRVSITAESVSWASDGTRPESSTSSESTTSSVSTSKLDSF